MALGAAVRAVAWRGDGGALAAGRSLHSSTFQLNLSRFAYKTHPKYPLIPSQTF